MPVSPCWFWPGSAGFREGAAYPSAYNLIYGWMAGTEISRSVGLISAAAALGTVFALLVVGKFIELWGWPSVFYTFGAMGVVLVRALVFYRTCDTCIFTGTGHRSRECRHPRRSHTLEKLFFT